MINVRPKIKLNGRASGLSMREYRKMHDSAIKGVPLKFPGPYQIDRMLNKEVSSKVPIR